MPQDFPEVVSVHPEEALAVQEHVPEARPHPPEPRRHQQLPEGRILVLVVPAGQIVPIIGQDKKSEG